MAELDGKQVGTLQQDAVNKTGHQNTQSHNLFDLSHYNALTARFGDLTPFLCKEVVPGDNVRFGSNHELRTLTLAAPVLSPVRMHKDYFFVPMKSLMSHWDEIISNEINNMALTNPQYELPRFNIYNLYKQALSTGQDVVRAMTNAESIKGIPIRYFQFLVLLRNLVSQGSLLRLLQYPEMPSYINHDSLVPELDNATLEQVLDYLWTCMFNKELYVDTSEVDPITYIKGLTLKTTGNTSAAVNISSQSDNVKFGNSGNSIAKLLDILEHYNVAGSDITFVNDSDAYPFPAGVLYVLETLQTMLGSMYSAVSSLASASYDTNPECWVNPLKLVAYHAIAVQFFTNDKVDDITNVRQFILAYFGTTATSSSSTEVPSIYTNGPTYWTMNRLISAITYSNFLSDESFASYAKDFYCMLRLLCFDNALKYGDYFIGSRPRPISVGDVSITVADGKVQAIDVTKNLLVQKLLNAINKLGASISEYSKGIFGEAPRFVDATPQFLARSTTYIGNPETVNTADNQGAITSQFRSVDGKYEFSASFNDFGYIIGIMSFDVLPCYPHRVDRDAFHTDFYTFFNPMLQNIGDQPVMLNELANGLSTVGSRFGYQQRYAEYKSMASYCTGGFAVEGRSLDFDNLQSWIFQVPEIAESINPYIIRHHRGDFDRFYSAIAGLGLSQYVHFAVIFNNDLKINRKMQFQSTLL